MFDIIRPGCEGTELFTKYIVKTNKRFVYYTAIFGEYDTLKKPILNNINEYDFICFTDNRSLIKKNKGWRIVVVEELYRDPRRTAKIFKILNHHFIVGCEYSIWCDGKNEIIRDIVPYILESGPIELKAFRHPSRDCTYDEARVCIKEKKDLPEILEPQMKKYQRLHFPKHQGLLNGSLIIRNHESKIIVKAMEEWWGEINKHSVRDQVSLIYVLWKNGVKDIEIDKRPDIYIKNQGHERYIFYDNNGTPFVKKKVNKLLIKIKAKIKILLLLEY